MMWKPSLGLWLVILPALAANGGVSVFPTSLNEQELKSASEAFAEETVLTTGGTGVITTVRCGASGVTLALTGTDGSSRTLTFHPFSESLPPKPGEVAPRVLPDAGIEVVELKLRYHVRPNLAVLKESERSRFIKEWDSLPSPLIRPLPLSLRQNGDGVELYIDGGYAGIVLPKVRLKSVRVNVCPGSSIGRFFYEYDTPHPGRVAVDVRRLDRPGALADAAVTLTDDKRVREMPFFAPFGNLDLSVTARQESVCGNYTYRSAFDGLAESFIFTVPSAQYIRAWMLCAVEDDAGKDPSVTARLTRFVSKGAYSGRARECLADTTVVLPRGSAAAGTGITRVGTVSVKGSSVPLYLVEVPLDVGAIQDLLFDEQGPKQRGTLAIGPYLDFELLGRLCPQGRPHPFGDGRYFPDARYPSGVHVFGVTLEKTPVEMEVRQARVGNIFHNDEVPELTVALRPRVDGEFLLRWAIRDADGKDAGGGEKQCVLKQADGEQIVPVSLQQPQLGWYEIDCTLWQGERRLLNHVAAFALLGPDTRRAGFESPYASWWFLYDCHYGTRDPAVIGPVLLKAGFRRVHLCGPEKYTEAELAPWKFTAAASSWGPVESATEEKMEAYIKDLTTRYPHCGTVMVFHESMPNAPLGTLSAPELFGLPVKENPGADERWQKATRVAKLVRERFPELKIFIGNSGASSELIAEGMRRKFPETYADCIGIETVGRTGHPERLWEGGLPAVWFLRETARRLGYGWKVTSCFETNYREDRLLGAQRQAEWYVRDVLLSLAWQLPYISIALLHDTGNDYNASFWGGTGLCRRFPYLYPKKAYVAMATVTRVLDRVTLQREVPTGSNSVYALEFARADGKTVCAFWTSRGTCELQVELGGNADVEVVDLYGRARRLVPDSGRLGVCAGTAVQYLVMSGSIARIGCGKRTYPDDQPPAGVKVVNAMDKVEEWQLSTAKDPLLEMTAEPHLPFRTAGEFVVRAVTDAEKGGCLEVELQPGKDLPTPLLSEYAVLRLRTPVPLAGEPTTLGIWVKGNSGWGQVYWEIEDAKGVRRISCGTTEHKADVFDYDGRVSIDFDGWNFLQFPITEKSAIPDLSTGSVANLWEASVRGQPVASPIKVTGVAFSLPRQALHLTEMVPVQQVIRFRDLSALE